MALRDTDTVFSPILNAYELGHKFTLTSSQVISTARLYVHEPAEAFSTQVFWANIYESGKETATGPIRELIIPCNFGAVTGTGVSASFNNVPLSLLNAGDGYDVTFTTPDGNLKAVGMYFATNNFIQELTNKRILDVSLLYSGYGYRFDANSNYTAVQLDKIGPINVTVTNDGGTNSYFGGILDFDLTDGASASTLRKVNSISFGETTWLSTAAGTPGLPIKINDLQRLEFTTVPNRVRIQVSVTNYATADPDTVVGLSYAALKVTYCDENRTAVGVNTGPLVPGMNLMPVRGVDSQTANPVLTAGDYYITLSAPNLGNPSAESGTYNPLTGYPKLNAVRQLYTIPSHPGLQINIPTPVTDRIGDVFTSQESQVLPQISLHTSGGPITTVHVYGRQAVAQVWGSNTAVQQIQDNLAGGSASWPWVRFYARRFNNTTTALTLTGAGQSVSITPAEFDALEEVADGWKEVTLRFSTAPTMGSGTIPPFTWSASGETAGNRWEVLGCTAPALSGMPNSLITPVPSPNQLSIATYGQPASGATINLSWIPQYAPPVSAVTADQTSDATIIFAQDMPTVTGFTVSSATQALTGIGQNCDLNPCGIPTALLYNQLSWSATSSAIPASGFGYYELQRMDTVETDWATIMTGTSPTGASFNDYEARIDIETSYRIRAVDVYGFYGEWSSTVSITTPSPGVSGSCLDGAAHILVFSSNERQDGADNLAYSTVWNGGAVVSEDFTFPEAQTVQLQPMYNRDFFTAFRPLERGGEQFTRTLLVQAAAISPETLADFRSLRDMAWDTVNYVCVKDEEGNRWFASVTVPAGSVTKNRTLYMAPVSIAEVTSTPTPVDPWS